MKHSASYTLDHVPHNVIKDEAWAIYLRKSRADIEAEKLGEGETLKRHREILTNLAVRKGLYIDRVYEEIVSGETIEARPEMQRLLEDCYAGKYKGIVVIDVDRLSRGNQGDMQTIMDCLKFSNNNRGILVTTPTKTYDVAHNSDDEEYMEFVLFMSRREYKTIQKRLDRGRKQAVVEGNFMGSYRPYGWDIVKTKYYRTLTPNPDEAKWVRKIYEWSAYEKLTAGKIAKRLDSLGVPTYTGAPEWNNSTVKEILRNPINKGKVRWNDRMQVKKMADNKLVASRPRSNHTDHYMEYDGKHKDKAIVDDELFALATERIKSDHTKSGVKLANPLAGLLVCKKCQKLMVRNTYPKRKNTPDRFAHPSTKMCDGVKSALLDDVMEAFVYGLKMNIDEFQMQIDNTPETDETSINEQIDALNAELRKTERKMSKLFDAWEDETITNNEFVSRKQVHANKIESIKKQLHDLEQNIPEKEDFEEKIMKLSDALDALKSPDVDAETKNKYLKEIIEKIEFSRDNNDEFTLDIYLL